MKNLANILKILKPVKGTAYRLEQTEEKISRIKDKVKQILHSESNKEAKTNKQKRMPMTFKNFGT